MYKMRIFYDKDVTNEGPFILKFDNLNDINIIINDIYRKINNTSLTSMKIEHDDKGIRNTVLFKLDHIIFIDIEEF